MGVSNNPWLAATLVLPTFLAAFATLLLACDRAQVAPLWSANAVVAALLMETPRRRWWAGLLAGAVGLFFADVLDGAVSATPLLLSADNLLEILICAGLVRLVAKDQVNLARPSHLAAFLVAAGIVAPACSATIAAPLLHAARGAPFGQAWSAWYAGDASGLVLVTPILLPAWRALARRYPA